MEIVSLALGTSSISNREIESPVHRLNFTITGRVPGTNFGTNNLTGILVSLIGSMKINLQKQDGTANETLMENLSVMQLAEMATHGEGCIVIRENYDYTDYVVTFSVEVCPDGALELGEHQKLMLGLSSIPAAAAVVIDALDHPVTSPLYVKYENKFVNANTQKSFAIDNALAIALPRVNFTKLELLYNNGKNVILNKREIEQILMDAEDTIIDDRSVYFITGMHDLYILSVEEAIEAKVTLDASTNFFLIKNQAI
jgi:hypothetical protein